jgi:hypothetical protein
MDRHVHQPKEISMNVNRIRTAILAVLVVAALVVLVVVSLPHHAPSAAATCNKAGGYMDAHGMCWGAS